MIDWVSCRFPYHGPPVGDVYLKKDWQTGEVQPAFNRHVQVKSSYDAGMSVQVIGREMMLSGNVVKFLTGQNVVGTDDLHFLVRAAYEAVCQALGLPHCLVAHAAIKNGNVYLSRVDCTFHYHVGSDDDVRSWLRAMESSVHVRYRGRGFYDEGMASLMFGLKVKEGQKIKGSAYSSFKFYNKATELKKHKPTCKHQFVSVIQDMAQGVVRAEALYRSKDLEQNGCKRLKDWNGQTSYELHRKWIEKMEISANVELKTEVMENMPKKLLPAYKNWLNGEDMLAIYTRPTFYRYRRQLLEYGIDIHTVSTKKDNVVVIPVLRVLEARPVHVAEGEVLFQQMLKAA